MKYTIPLIDETFEADTYHEAFAELCVRLRSDSPRELTARSEDGVEVHAELQGHHDYIRAPGGRLIYSNA